MSDDLSNIDLINEIERRYLSGEPFAIIEEECRKTFGWSTHDIREAHALIRERIPEHERREEMLLQAYRVAKSKENAVAMVMAVQQLATLKPVTQQTVTSPEQARDALRKAIESEVEQQTKSKQQRFLGDSIPR